MFAVSPPCGTFHAKAPSLVRAVLQHGARVNTPRGDRRIPLHTAMRLPPGQNKLSIVGTLLVVGADIDRPGTGGWPMVCLLSTVMGCLRLVVMVLFSVDCRWFGGDMQVVWTGDGDLLYYS